MKIKFNEIAHFVAGQSPESKYYSPKEGVPFLQGNRTFGSMYPSIDTYTTKVTKIAKKGDVLMSVRAPVGDLNIAPCDLCIGRGLSAISSKDNDNMFVYYVLKYNIKNIVKNGSGTTYDSITKDIIDNIELIVPDNKKKWSNISKILFSIDEQIRRNDDMVQKLPFSNHLLNFSIEGGINHGC